MKKNRKRNLLAKKRVNMIIKKLKKNNNKSLIAFYEWILYELKVDEKEIKKNNKTRRYNMKNNINNEYGHCYYCTCDNKCAMIYNLYIIKEHRRKGHAKELVQKAIDEIRATGYKQDIKIVAEPEGESITKKDLVKFYNKMNLKVVDSKEVEHIKL